MVRAAPTWVAVVLLLGASPSLDALQGEGGARPAGDPRAAADPLRGAGEGGGPVLLEVPYVSQPEALCGGAAAAMVLRYWGTAAGARDFARLLTPDGSGIRTADLVRAVRARGWRSIAFRGDPSLVRAHLRRGRPVVLLLRVGEARFHYVVVVGWDGTAFRLHDPVLGPERRLEPAALEERWAPTGRWAWLVLPRVGIGAPTAGTRTGAVRREGERRGPGSTGDAGCHRLLEGAAAAARSGSSAEAERLLDAAGAECSDPAAVLAARAGLRLREGRPAEAARLARRAVGGGSADPHALRTLAASRYLEGRDLAALAAWSEAGAAEIQRVRIRGLERTRDRPVRRLLGLGRGGSLTPGRLRRARRRLEDLPAAGASGVEYRPRPEGRVEVGAAILETSPLPDSPAEIAIRGVEALLSRRIELRAVDPWGGGGAGRAWWGWRPGRREVGVGASVPVPFGLPGVWSVEGTWRRQDFRSVSGDGGADAGSAGTTGAVGTEEWRRGRVGARHWVSGTIGLESAVGLERWAHRRALEVSGSAGLRIRGDDGRFAGRAGLRGWLPLGGSRTFGTGEVRGRWRSSPRRRGWRLDVRAGWRRATAAAPRSVWPRGGVESGLDALQRAHPLVVDDVASGALLGRTLLTSGVEVARWLPSFAVAGTVPGIAGFVDGARIAGRHGIGGSATHVDAGLGLRLALPDGGTLRVDLARGLADGRTLLSAGWNPAWPGWR